MVKKPRSIWSPDHLTDALLREQNKLIHLDPVPIFKERGDIKTWLQKIFFPQGIDLVIERSDSGKVIFKCKSNIRHEYKKRNAKNSNDDNKNDDNKSEPKFCCPFRIRATFSLKLQKWNIVVVNNVHSHELEFNPTSDEYKKFKKLLIANNDLETCKNFEELEYKTKLKLPILPQVMTCDCGLTNEINWFDVVLPEPRISVCKTTKKIEKKKKNKKLQQNNVIPMVSESLSSFLTQDQIDATIQNVKQEEELSSLPQTPMVNLDEIDFTDMFKTPKSNHSLNNTSNSNSLTLIKKEKESPKHTTPSSSLSSTTLLESQPILNHFAGDSLSYNTNLASPLHLDETMSSELLMMKTTNDYNISMDQMDMHMDAMTILDSIGQVCEDPEEESAVFKESAWIGLCPGLTQQEHEIDESTLQPTPMDRTSNDSDDGNNNNNEQLNSYLDFLNIANCPI